MASTLRILVGAGKASPSPPVGPALGQKGVKAMDFCKQFNARTAQYIQGIPIPTFVTVQKDRSFTFTVKTPPVSYIVKQALGKELGAKQPGHEDFGTLSLKHIYEIAKIKHLDLPHLPLESVTRQVLGGMRSLGVTVVR